MSDIKTDNRRLFFGTFLVVFLLFTLVYMTSVDGIIYDHVCANTELLRTYQSNITTDSGIETVMLDREPINCTYGCTNLTFPASCRLNTATDLWVVNFMPMPLFILLEIIAFFFFSIGIIFKSGEGETFIILPVMSMVIFLVLGIVSINIEGQYNMVMMWFNWGFGMVSLVYVIYSFFVGAVKQFPGFGDDNDEE